MIRKRLEAQQEVITQLEVLLQQQLPAITDDSVLAGLKRARQVLEDSGETSQNLECIYRI